MPKVMGALEIVAAVEHQAGVAHPDRERAAAQGVDAVVVTIAILIAIDIRDAQPPEVAIFLQTGGVGKGARAKLELLDPDVFAEMGTAGPFGPLWMAATLAWPVLWTQAWMARSYHGAETPSTADTRAKAPAEPPAPLTGSTSPTLAAPLAIGGHDSDRGLPGRRRRSSLAIMSTSGGGAMTIELAYQATGEGSPVVVLHGLLGSARNWATIARQLGERHRVFCLDLRNHGESPWAETMTFGEMAEDVAAFLERHDLPSATVIGHSMGGKVAMRLALSHGERVTRLMVVDVAPVAYDHSFADYLEAMQRVDLASTSRRADIDARLAEAIPDQGVRAFLLQNLVRSDAGFAWRVNLDALRANMDAIMASPAAEEEAPYEGPTLFVAGGRSPYVLPEHRRAIERWFPRAELVTIDDAGHWVHAERPAEFLSAVRRFLG